MKKALITITCLVFSSGFALAADTATTTTTPGAGGPTKAMDAATPTMKSPGDPNAEHPPAAAMDKAVPPMKSGDTSAANATAGSMSQADCDAAWKKANPSNAKTITVAQANVSDMKAADPDNDGTLDQAEFSKACASGLVSK